jgi:hypothetical protein
MINMALKWHDIDICNKICNFDHHLTWFLVHLIVIAPLSVIVVTQLQLNLQLMNN